MIRIQAWILLIAAFVLMNASRPSGPLAVLDVPLRVDPNTCPEAVLLALPRIGPVLVKRIVAARGTLPFRSLDDLDLRVKGIGPATIEALRPHLLFG